MKKIILFLLLFLSCNQLAVGMKIRRSVPRYVSVSSGGGHKQLVPRSQVSSQDLDEMFPGLMHRRETDPKVLARKYPRRKRSQTKTKRPSKRFSCNWDDKDSPYVQVDDDLELEDDDLELEDDDFLSQVPMDREFARQSVSFQPVQRPWQQRIKTATYMFGSCDSGDVNDLHTLLSFLYGVPDDVKALVIKNCPPASESAVFHYIANVRCTRLRGVTTVLCNDRWSNKVINDTQKNLRRHRDWKPFYWPENQRFVFESRFLFLEGDY